MIAVAPLTAVRLREVLHYDPETGIFTRRVRAAIRLRIGDVAGSPDKDGYIRICVGGKRYYAHRLAWLYMTGDWPPHLIDHRDTVTNNNIWKNLRAATNAQNLQNMRKAGPKNKCGFLGVCAHQGHWMASIKVSGKKIFIGYYDTPELAHKAYCEAKAKYHPFQTIVS